MASPTGPSPASSTLTPTYTPYPNVLNPVDGPHTPMGPFAPPMVRSIQQTNRQHHQQLPSLPPLSQAFQFEPTTKPFHLQSNPNGPATDADLGGLDDMFLTSSGFEQVIFPGCFVTSFDDHNLFSGIGLKN